MKRLALSLAAFIIFLTPPLKANAQEPELRMMRATAYIGDSEWTYSGAHVRPGIAAMRKEDIGKTAIVYQRLPGNEIGEVIGIYEIEDTGSAKGVANGNVIDIWYPDLDGCQSLMNRVYEDGCQGKVFVQVLEAKG